MRMTIAAVTALAGSLLLAPTMLGPAKAAGAPDLKNALSATHDGALFAAALGVALWAVLRWEEVTWAVDGEVDGEFITAVVLVLDLPRMNSTMVSTTTISTTSITVASSSTVPSSLAATRTMATATVIG